MLSKGKIVLRAPLQERHSLEIHLEIPLGSNTPKMLLYLPVSLCGKQSQRLQVFKHMIRCWGATASSGWLTQLTAWPCFSFKFVLREKSVCSPAVCSGNTGPALPAWQLPTSKKSTAKVHPGYVKYLSHKINKIKPDCNKVERKKLNSPLSEAARADIPVSVTGCVALEWIQLLNPTKHL